VSHLTLRLYHGLPAPARSVAATLHGWYLRWWRYGPDAERLVAEARERERWSAERWRVWREERLAYLLHRAATRVPYYRQQWEARRRNGDCASWEQLEHWPILEKDAVRAQPRAFVADDCDVRRMLREQTSGTTGKPLVLWRSRRTLEQLYALSAARTRLWHGVTGNDRWAMLGGQLVVPVEQARPPFWVWNAALRQLYLSSYHLARELIPYYLDALARYRIVYLYGYASSMTALALEALRLGRRDLRLRVAITNSEPLLKHQRAAIADAFGCPVRETYGMAETVAAASECDAGTLHQWPEVGFIERFADGAPAAAQASGELVCTGLLNPDMPLVRYRVGDSGRVADPTAGCRCGRTLPALAAIDGRTNDLLITRDGRRVYWLNPVFYGLPLREAQIVQEHLERLRVRYSPAPGFSADTAREIVARLRARMGAVAVELEEVAVVPHSAAGKLRAVVCELPADEKAAALARRATAGRGTDGPGARPDTGPSPGPRATEPPLPLISVVIPCRDEEPYIGACLESILGSDYPQERLEVLVADGMSRDQSRDIVARYAVQHPSIRLLDNPQQVTPTGLNAAIRMARGDIIMRMDAHAVYPPHYIPRLVAALRETAADNVGGVIDTLPADDTPIARAIAAALAHPFGVGNAYFRIGVTEPRLVQNIPFGCWQRDVFTRIGLFDEEMVRNQDDEFNQRLIQHGGRILLVPDVVSQYYARRSLRQVARMYLGYGYFKPLVFRKVGRVMNLRQLIPALFILSLALTAAASAWIPGARFAFFGIVGAYAAAVLGCAFHTAHRHGAACGAAAAAVFPTLHVSYGLGFIRGVWDHTVRRHRRRAAVAVLPQTAGRQAAAVQPRDS